ncbi:MAG TPA: glycosyltransferase [Chitinophagaceae bacterium]
MNERNLVIGIYYHPEAYPPTLNAVQMLSESFSEITIVHRPHLNDKWQYPSNVRTIPSGSFITSKEQEQSSVVRKVGFFWQFTNDLLRAIRAKKPSVVLLYDVHALFAYKLIRPLIGKHFAWYHNHDVSELSRERRFSIGWFAVKSEKRLFSKLDMFTLPSAERLRFFPLENFKGQYFVIPNYPSLKFYGSFFKLRLPDSQIRLLFQGRIGEGHGLEEIIKLLHKKVAGKDLHLVLKGFCDQEYKEKLLRLATEYNVADKVSFIGFTPYEEVPRIAATCHIGIGIFSKRETMHVTLGTASNKLYEYAAVGLPIIYLNEDHFNHYLKNYTWAFPVDLNENSILNAVGSIVDNYAGYSNAANKSFRESLNFEKSFKPVLDYISTQKTLTK